MSTLLYSRGGAQWRTHATPDTPEQCQWDIESYRFWMGIIDKEEKDGSQASAPKSGLGVRTTFRSLEVSRHHCLP